MSSRGYMANEERVLPSFKVTKVQPTLLSRGKASEDLRLKRMLVYRAENPRVLKDTLKKHAPVIWISKKKAWVMITLFEEWFPYHFASEVKKYCDTNELLFHKMLLSDNKSGHLPILQNLHPNVKDIYLPPNTPSLLQPMDQSVIATFNVYNLSYTFAMLNE